MEKKNNELSKFELSSKNSKGKTVQVKKLPLFAHTVCFIIIRPLQSPFSFSRPFWKLISLLCSKLLLNFISILSYFYLELKIEFFPRWNYLENYQCSIVKLLVLPIGFCFPRISVFSTHAREKNEEKKCEKEQSEEQSKKREEKASIFSDFRNVRVKNPASKYKNCE